MTCLFSHRLVLLALLSLTLVTSFFNNNLVRHDGNQRMTFLLKMAAKYDPSDFITVKVKKPLGISLEEVVVNEPRGVYVSDVLEGNAKATNKIYKGLILLAVNGKDVKSSDFDAVMDTLKDPAFDTLELTFIDNRKIEKGPAKIKVNLIDGRTVEINTLKGTLLRPLLLENKLELYQGASKLTNCGGGGSCGTCVVSVTDNEDWEERPDFEAKKLKKYTNAARLSCNTLVEGDCTVTLGLR